MRRAIPVLNMICVRASVPDAFIQGTQSEASCISVDSIKQEANAFLHKAGLPAEARRVPLVTQVRAASCPFL